MSCMGVSARSHLGYCLGEMGRWQDAFTTLLPATGIAVTIIRDLARFSANAGDMSVPCFWIRSHCCWLRRRRSAPQRRILPYEGRPSAGCAWPVAQGEQGQSRGSRYLIRPWLTLARMKNGKKARPCFRRVLQLDAKYFWAWYDLACLDALERKPAAAFQNLNKSIDCGFKDVDYLLRDSDFKNIQEDPRWKVVVECVSSRGVQKLSADGMKTQHEGAEPPCIEGRSLQRDNDGSQDYSVGGPGGPKRRRRQAGATKKGLQVRKFRRRDAVW